MVSLLDRDDLRFEVCALLTLFTDRPESIASGISTTLVSNLLGWVNQKNGSAALKPLAAAIGKASPELLAQLCDCGVVGFFAWALHATCEADIILACQSLRLIVEHGAEVACSTPQWARATRGISMLASRGYSFYREAHPEARHLLAALRKRGSDGRPPES